MEHSGSTPQQAIEKAKAWLELLHQNRPDLLGGLFFVEEKLENHPMRRYVAGYIKGGGESTVMSNCKLVDGIYMIDHSLIAEKINRLGWRAWG